MKTIRLTQGKEALVDDNDFAYLSQRKWFAVKDRNNFYAATRQGVPKVGNKRPPYVRMHQLLAQHYALPFKDHWDGNGLNNQKDNLRGASSHQNIANSRIRSDNKSGFKGVWWCKSHRKWGAKLATTTLGWFETPILAAKTYDSAAIEKYGDFAKTNKALGLL